MYMGTAVEATPAPMPPSRRPPMSTDVVGDQSISRPPSKKKAVATSSARLRPQASQSRPEPIVPSMAPTVVDEAIAPVAS
eukprot:4776085-Prymnesium_polylepis.1